jgi:hypothetical protein
MDAGLKRQGCPAVPQIVQPDTRQSDPGHCLQEATGEPLRVPYEVSLTQSPASSDALVLSVGAESLRTYEALTGIEPATALLAGGGRD